MNRTRITKTILITVLLTASFQAWSGTETPKKNSLLVVTEPSWVPSKKETSYQVVRSGSGKTLKYEFILSQKGRESKSSVISEEQYNHLRDKLFGLLVQKDARKPAATRCQASIKIQLYQLKENGLVCAGDFRHYYQAKAFLAEIIQRTK